MAKDDYFVIVYRILDYLYGTLKAGKPVNVELISAVNKRFVINQPYWEYIIRTIYADGYLAGITVYQADDETHITGLEGIQITPKGIEYLLANSMMTKVKQALKDVKEIVPGL